MSAAKQSKKCTCGPHPVVDLTTAIITGDDNKQRSRPTHTPHQQAVACRPTHENRQQYDGTAIQTLRDACQSHGCFHLRLNNTDFITYDDDDDDDKRGNNNIRPSAVKSLSKLAGDLSPKIQSLFDKSMLTSTLLDPNGGLKEVEYRIRSDTKRRCATYRGRTSESGASGDANSKPEPKQSWEARRCIPRHEGVLPSMSFRLEVLEGWTNALHRAAEIVVRILDIEPNTVLKDGPCKCSELPYSGLERHCCMDLLRVFRYDALDTEADRSNRPGSSAHSDWGTLTVVWQDTSGGLQTYCHECDKWSDVKAPTSTGDGKESSTVDLFVHVGDFLSLATGGEYPSPRHRVLCPLSGAGANNGKKDSRCSLVYFAYPAPGVSLGDVEKKLSGTKDDGEKAMPAPYERYSLLHDQSAPAEQCGESKDESISFSSRIVYERIRDMPFDEVVMEKWSQVQRK